jgi:hypothetical protein
MVPWTSTTLAFWRIVFANYSFDEIEELKALCR